MNGWSSCPRAPVHGPPDRAAGTETEERLQAHAERQAEARIIIKPEIPRRRAPCTWLGQWSRPESCPSARGPAAKAMNGVRQAVGWKFDLVGCNEPRSENLAK